MEKTRGIVVNREIVTLYVPMDTQYDTSYVLT